MFDYDTIEIEDTDLEQRDARALTEYMTVLPLGGDVYSVTTQSRAEYRVDTRGGRCTCPDYEYREVLCKHCRRVVFATGERPIPAWVDANEVDAQLGEHVEEAPKVAATDGGVSLEEFVTKDTDKDGWVVRRVRCDCGNRTIGLPTDGADEVIIEAVYWSGQLVGVTTVDRSRP